MAICGIGKSVSVNVQLCDEAKVEAEVNDHDEAFTVLRLGTHPNQVTVYLTLDVADDLAEQIRAALHKHALKVANAEAAQASVPVGQ